MVEALPVAVMLISCGVRDETTNAHEAAVCLDSVS